MSKIFQQISFAAMVALYLLAGINHFIKPGMYYPLIPAYLPWPVFINTASGIAEIVLALLLVYKPTRKLASIGIILLLLAFIPTHIYMIQKGGCMSAAVCIPAWASWLRLFPLQFLMMYWAWKNGTYTRK